jgi:stage IV sporulation protein FB
MNAREPGRTMLDLRWRMFGVEVRIHPLFWIAAAALGWGFLAEPDHGGVELFVLWMVCLLVSLLVHEFGHVLVGRLFGVRLHVVLSGLGGFTGGMENVKRLGPRIAVRLGGPLAQGILLGLLWALTSGGIPFPEAIRQQEWLAKLIANGLYVLFLINLVWPLLNLLPIWPLDGGLILRDLLDSWLGVPGSAMALAVCLFVPGVLAVGLGQWINFLAPGTYDPRLSVSLQMACLLMFFCLVFVVKAFSELGVDYRRSRSPTPAPGKTSPT